MPRAFSETEKETIRAQLLEQGRLFLATYGVKKTSVEDLTNAAGISKGAFYLFFPSKEELFFSIFEQFEADYRADMLRLAALPGQDPRRRLRAFFEQAFTLWRTSPLFAHFDRDTYEYLARRLPAERVQAHYDDDEGFVAQLLARWRETGIIIDMTPKEFTALMRALFFVSLHADDIGDPYPATIALLSDMVAAHFSQSSE